MIGGGLELLRKYLVNNCNSQTGFLNSEAYNVQGAFTAAVFFTSDEVSLALLVYKSKCSI